MYPQVFLNFDQKRQLYGDVSVLPTPQFYYGMEPGEEILVELEPGKTLIIKFLTVGEPHPEGKRTVFFELNGQPREVSVQDESLKAQTVERAKADPANPGHVGAPIPGAVTSIMVETGESVSKGDRLLVIEAMKMQTTVYAPIAGKARRETGSSWRNGGHEGSARRDRSDHMTKSRERAIAPAASVVTMICARRAACSRTLVCADSFGGRRNRRSASCGGGTFARQPLALAQAALCSVDCPSGRSCGPRRITTARLARLVKWFDALPVERRAEACREAGLVVEMDPMDEIGLYRFTVADQVPLYRLMRCHRRSGIGVPVVAWRPNDGSDRWDMLRPPEGIFAPATAVLAREDAGRWTLRFLSPYSRETVIVEGRTYALAANFSAPIAKLARRAEALRRSAFRGMLNPSVIVRREKLYMMQRYDPKRIPLLMVHGLMSTPISFANLT